ncbi:uncharacterized 30.3 kDa protein-like [Helicoverpa zea]|uniref:uncharacterized 30.3 kDa protein-like n=1 Tax=Helicoverpa zea TaxID=7113 RepID=UPI001F5AC505|nr:uncharacterized 30.3 kDa protein-like [Helicoverpa zea]
MCILSHHHVIGYVHVLMVILLVSRSHAAAKLWNEQNNMISNETAIYYSEGVRMGIINPEKYSLQSFEQHEREMFKDTYRDFISLNGTQAISYQEWLILNNYGILYDTQESVLEKKTSTRSTVNKDLFVKNIQKGDILITTKFNNGFIGHVAIMATDDHAIELPGGLTWMLGIADNNRVISKDAWFNDYGSGWTTVYRCPDKAVADSAAEWAYLHYYNPLGLAEKTIHTLYRLNFDFESTNPSYCSKLVLQAFVFSNRPIIHKLHRYGFVIPPIQVPGYFEPPYKLKIVGKF